MTASTIEAGTDTAGAEAEAALQEAADQLEAKEMARRSREAAETGMTQAEREATAGFEPRAPQQGNLAGGWEELIGGNQPSESKIQVIGGGIQPVNAPEHLRKGSTHRILIDVTVSGFTVDDSLDAATGEVSATKSKRKLKITGAQFLQPGEYITSDDSLPE